MNISGIATLYLTGSSVANSASHVSDIATPGAASIQDLADTLSSSATTSEEKTNFLIEYLLAQRSVILDGIKVLLFALLVFFIGRKIVKFAMKMTKKWMVKHDVDVSVQSFTLSFAKILYNLILIFIVAGILGVGATIVAIVSSAGIAIGLALQGSMANLAGGVLILFLKPFGVGDYIVASGAEGTVVKIELFYTTLSTTDNKIVVIPNGTITSSNIVNTTNASKRMLILDFMVSYDTDIDKVKELLMNVMKEDPLLCQQEDMSVVINRFTPMKVQMQLKAWAKTEDYWTARYGMLEKMKKTLEENGISLN